MYIPALETLIWWTQTLEGWLICFDTKRFPKVTARGSLLLVWRCSYTSNVTPKTSNHTTPHKLKEITQCNDKTSSTYVSDTSTKLIADRFEETLAESEIKTSPPRLAGSEAEKLLVLDLTDWCLRSFSSLLFALIYNPSGTEEGSTLAITFIPNKAFKARRRIHAEKKWRANKKKHNTEKQNNHFETGTHTDCWFKTWRWSHLGESDEGRRPRQNSLFIKHIFP